MKISRRLEQDAQTRGKAGGMCQMHKQEAHAKGTGKRHKRKAKAGGSSRSPTQDAQAVGPSKRHKQEA